MKNGDAYKIKSLAKLGVSDSDICHRFRNRYDEEEVKSFIPAKPKKKAPRKKATTK